MLKVIAIVAARNIPLNVANESTEAAMRYLAVLILLLAAGCNGLDGVAPIESAIENSSERDFELTGTWIPAATSEEPLRDATVELTIKRDGDYTVTAVDTEDDDAEVFTAKFRTHELSKDHPHAIIELEYVDLYGKPHRRLAITAVKDDHLYLWPINGRKLGEQLYSDKTTAVIEHFPDHSTVRCDPKALLDTIGKHSEKLIDPFQVMQRKGGAGG